MTDGPQQPHHPRPGWTPPQPAPDQERQVLEGRIFPAQQRPVSPQSPSQPRPAAPDQPQAPAWSPPPSGLGHGGFPPAAPQQPPASPGPAASEPDWNALAEQREAVARRRRLLMIGGGVLAVAAIGGIVATAVVASNSGDKQPSAHPSANVSEQPLPPEPSFSSIAPPPPVNPLDYISTAKKDTAPLTPDTLFPGKQLAIGGRSYTKTTATSTTSCDAAAAGDLSGALAGHGCRQIIRATYVQGEVAVTVGIAAFDDAAAAAKLKDVSQYLLPLNGGGVTDFCHAVACRMTSNAVGRYAYFTIAGLKNGQTITASDTAAKQAGTDTSNFAFNRIVQRGRDAANADQSSH